MPEPSSATLQFPVSVSASRALMLASPFVPTQDDLWLMDDKEFTPAREHEFESMFAVSNGYIGSRGSIPMGIPMSDTTVFIAGVYDAMHPSALPELVAIPGWTVLSQSFGSNRLTMANVQVKEHRRTLDLKKGMFRRIFRFGDKEGRITHINFLRIASLADRHVLLQSMLCVPENYSGTVAIQSGFMPSSHTTGTALASATVVQETPHGPVQVLEGQTRNGVKIAIAVSARITDANDGMSGLSVKKTVGAMDDLTELDVEAGKTYRMDWLEVCYTSRDTDRPKEAAVSRLERLLREGVMPAIEQHVECWNCRWQTADVQITGEDEAQRAIRFASYHLVSAANPEDDHVSIGARALTGPGYKGHVFWDTEIYLLPFYIFTDPASARALLMYRFHTLAAAKAKALQQGYQGALYAWESADTGEEVTPLYAITPVGTVLPVVTGVQAHHISADVAYAVWQYWNATGDDAFLNEAGAEILMETARFWASRVAIENDGLYHIRKVIGPDEYHEGVDDSAYTNWMAQWNLHCAADMARVMQARWPQQWRQLAQRMQLEEAELQRWVAISAAMYTGVHAESGLIEQFQGYFGLEEIDLATLAPRSLPIDVVLGRERTQGAQPIKQADVVLLLYLLWQRFPSAIHESNFRYYEPRTEHGSSLSPSIHALVAARLGDTALALDYFRQACEIDLADNMGNASGGVHIASLGGLWQAVVFGFAGLSVDEQGMHFRPHCPSAWQAIRFSLMWRGQKVQVHVEPARLDIELINQSPAESPVESSVPISVAGTRVLLEAAHRSRWEVSDGIWKEVEHDRP